MTPSSLIKGIRKTSRPKRWLGLFGIVLTALVVAALYFRREFLIPLAVVRPAHLHAFAFGGTHRMSDRSRPRRLQRRDFDLLCLGSLGWSSPIKPSISRQSSRTTALTSRRNSISLELSKEGPIKRLSQMIVEVGSEIPGFETPETTSPESASLKPGARPAVQNPSNHGPERSVNPLDQVRWVATRFLSVLGTMAS